MTIKLRFRPTFTTSVGTSPATAARVDPDTLDGHVDACRTSANRMFRLRRTVEALDTFAAPRFMTTLVVFTVALIVLSLVV